MKNLIGQKFNMLTVIARYDNSNDIGRKRVKWICKCDCGNTTTVTSEGLEKNRTKSCGCYGKSKWKSKYLYPKRLNSIFKDMKERCYNKNSKSYKYYGGRGIKICDE